jgi:hypothetical protein
MMESDYKPEDLSKFEKIGEEAPELAKKFFEYYGAVSITMRFKDPPGLNNIDSLRMVCEISIFEGSSDGETNWRSGSTSTTRS